jgi:hypothetical protein
MTIAPDQSGSTAINTQVATATLDITAAADNTWVYAYVTLVGSVTVGATCTGWTTVTSDSPNTIILKRKKVSGDTTFTVNWTGNSQGVIVWVSISGAHATAPEESALATDFTGTARTAVPTTTVTPTAGNRYALAFFSVRTTTSANKAITWTSDAALTEIIDANNSAASSSAWVGAEIAISPAAVTNATHTYTATHNFAEGRDFSALLYLIPAAGSTNFGAGFFDGM